MIYCFRALEGLRQKQDTTYAETIEYGILGEEQVSF
jgi:hypothetical protein